jgi:iron complex outermembrane receptor protein
MPTHDQSFKYLYGRAFRAPNAFESNVVYFGDGVLALRPETIGTHEVVWERYTGDWLRTSVSSYWYKADHLITLTADPEALLGTTYVNDDEVRAKGLEVEAQFRGKRRLEGMLSYAWQDTTDRDTGASLPNSPQHMFKGRVSMPIAVAGSSIATEVITVSPRVTLDGTSVATATTANVTIVQPLNTTFEVFGQVRNLFDVAYADPAASALVQNAIYQNGRTFHVGLRWRLRAQ